METYPRGFAHVCYDGNMIVCGRKGVLQVCFLLFLSFRFGRRAHTHLTYKTVFHAESLRGRFFFVNL